MNTRLVLEGLLRNLRQAPHRLDLAFAVLFVLKALPVAIGQSATADEVAVHIPSGWLYWTTGRFSGGLSNFPLGQLLVAAPIALTGREYALFSADGIVLARLPNIVLGAMVVLGAGWLGRSLRGFGSGAAAGSLVTLCPNLSAHASLATLDMPITAAVLATVVSLKRFVGSPGWGNSILLGLAFTAGMLIKVQGLLLVPFVLAGFVVVWRRSERRGEVLALACLVFSIPWATTHLLYLHRPSPGELLWPPQFASTLGEVLAQARRERSSWVLGEYLVGGRWWYFPLAIAVKTPLPVLGLGIFALGRFLAAPLRERALLAWAALPFCVFVGAGVASRINIGLRHVLPAYPFLAVLAGIAATCASTSRPGRMASMALVAGVAIDVLSSWDHPLMYFNPVGGGPAGGHHVLLDSNYDWGQHDDDLRAFVETRCPACQVAPDAFHRPGGLVLVNASAREGLLNGGPDKAFRWLHDMVPQERVAHTWFLYNLPPEPPKTTRWRLALESARDEFARLVLPYRALDDEDWRMRQMRSFLALHAPGDAFDVARLILASNPEDRKALALAGEATVRWRLGATGFLGQEYLGDGRLRPPPADLPITTSDFPRNLHQIGASSEIERAFQALARALRRDERVEEAVQFDRVSKAIRAWHATATTDEKTR